MLWLNVTQGLNVTTPMKELPYRHAASALMGGA
jgi:hypothetical protein